MDNRRSARVRAGRVHEFFTTRSRLYNAVCPLPRGGCAAVAASAENARILHAGELEIRLGEGLVLANGRALALSVREFELLAAMAARAGAIVTRDDLYAEVWGGELRPGDRSVDVYVSKLRGKLEAAMPDRRFIHTHPGFGYRFQPQPANAGSGGGEPRVLGAQPIAGDAFAGMNGTTGPTEDKPQELSRNVHIGAVSDLETGA
jgi:DNA-binding response OmpR family regulator